MTCAIALIGVVTTAIRRALRSLEQCPRDMGRGSAGQCRVTAAPKNAQKPYPPQDPSSFLWISYRLHAEKRLLSRSRGEESLYLQSV